MMADIYDSLRERGCVHPKIFQAMFASMIGKNCPYPTIKAAADEWGLHPEQLRLFVRGKREPETKVLKALGYEKITLYALTTDTRSAPDG